MKTSLPVGIFAGHDVESDEVMAVNLGLGWSSLREKACMVLTLLDFDKVVRTCAPYRLFSQRPVQVFTD